MKKKNKSVVMGALVIILGGLLLLDSFALFDLQIKDYIFSWKTLLIVVGILMITSRKRFIGGVLVGSIGVILWLPTIFNYQFELNQVFWPAILVAIGVALLAKSSVLHKRELHNEEYVPFEEVNTRVTD